MSRYRIVVQVELRADTKEEAEGLLHALCEWADSQAHNAENGESAFVYEPTEEGPVEGEG